MQTYAFGTKLSFDLPEGLVADLLISYRVPLTFAEGKGARYRITPAGSNALFERLEIGDTHGGTLVRTCPYLCTLIQRLGGIKTEEAIAFVPTEGGGVEVWEGAFRVPLRPELLLPGPMQLVLTTPENLYGPDPLLHGVANAEQGLSRFRRFLRWLKGKRPGKGHAITTQGGTVSVSYAF